MPFQNSLTALTHSPSIGKPDASSVTVPMTLPPAANPASRFATVAPATPEMVVAFV